MTDSQRLANRITSDYEDLLADIRAGLYDGRLEDEQKAWARLNNKICLHKQMRRFEREQDGIMDEERAREMALIN